MDASDAQLVELARRGSAEAAAELFDRYWTPAWKAAYAVTGNRALADDIAQEAIQRAFGALDRFDQSRPFGPWLKRIAVNHAVDELRRRGRLESLEAERPDSLHSWRVGDEPAEELGLWAVADAVAALPANKRIVVVLRYWLDYGPEEIAELLGIPVGTVASRLNRAQADLRAELQEDPSRVA